MAILKIKQPNGSWAIVGDTSETIKFTEQQLTDEQKKVARENIGAKAEVEEFIELEVDNLDDFVYNYSTNSWNRDPLKSYKIKVQGNPELRPDLETDAYGHHCKVRNGDILRGELLNADDNFKFHLYIKQTLYGGLAGEEHYRYWDEEGESWTKWTKTLDHPVDVIAANTTATPWNDNTIDKVMVFSEQSYAGVYSGVGSAVVNPDDLVNYYGDKHYVSYDKETNLTDDQKKQACDNIGAISTLRGEYIDSLDFIYSNGSWNHYPAGNYCGTSFQDINGEIITSWVLKGIELPISDQYLQYLFTEDNQYVRSIINKEVGKWRRVGIDEYIVKNDLNFTYYPDSDRWDYDPTLKYIRTSGDQIILDCEGVQHSARVRYWTLTGSGNPRATITEPAPGIKEYTLSIKQTLLDTENNMEHYRVYTYYGWSQNGGSVQGSGSWSKWYSNIPWPAINFNSLGEYSSMHAQYGYGPMTLPLVGILPFDNRSSSNDGITGSDTFLIDGNEVIIRLIEANALLRDSTTAYANGDILYYDNMTQTVRGAGLNYEVLKSKLDTMVDKDVNGNVIITGDLTVKGTTHTQDNETLRIADNIIELNSTKVDNSTTLSGIAINKDASSTYGVMYDPTDDTVKFGEGSTNEGVFTFGEGEGAPLAVRDDSSKLDDGAIMIFDKSKNRLVNSGYTIDSFKQWVRDYVETYMSTEIVISNNNAGGETLDINADNYTEENGTLTIGG